jgi:hypothetical protein
MTNILLLTLFLLTASVALSNPLISPPIQSIIEWKVSRDRTIEAYWDGVAYKFEILTYEYPKECQPIRKNGNELNWLTGGEQAMRYITNSIPIAKKDRFSNEWEFLIKKTFKP